MPLVMVIDMVTNQTYSSRHDERNIERSNLDLSYSYFRCLFELLSLTVLSTLAERLWDADNPFISLLGDT